MNFYKFPTITNITDVLPHIEGCPGFIVVNKGEYTVINYVMAGNDTFPPIETYSDKIKRECRGLIFDYAGHILSRRYHKFFNFGEREECLPENVDFNRPHVILEKLDGSMVSPCYVSGQLRWMTKMGITDTSLQAEAWVEDKTNYLAFAEENLNNGYTPIFEWCSNKNRIVLDYPEDRLVLTAIRHNLTGEYHPYVSMILESSDYDIDVVKSFEYDSKNITEIVREQEGVEGIVIRFDDGHMLKVKGEWYLRIHKVKAYLESEKGVTAAIINNELDDLLPILHADDRKRIEEFSHNLLIELSSISQIILVYIEDMKAKYPTKKDFALSEEAKLPHLSIFKRWVFTYFESEVSMVTIFKNVIAEALKSTSTNTNYDAFKKNYHIQVSMHGNKP